VLFAHGSRDPAWASPVTRLASKIRAARPDLIVEVAFLEIMPPALPGVLERLVASGHRRISIAPLFLARGAHLERDLAKLLGEIRARHDGVRIDVLPAIGEVDVVLDAVSAWLIEAAERSTTTGETQ
jgi:sirohydrochlorin cobaltochelatase